MKIAIPGECIFCQWLLQLDDRENMQECVLLDSGLRSTDIIMTLFENHKELRLTYEFNEGPLDNIIQRLKVYTYVQLKSIHSTLHSVYIQSNRGIWPPAGRSSSLTFQMSFFGRGTIKDLQKFNNFLLSSLRLLLKVTTYCNNDHCGLYDADYDVADGKHRPGQKIE